MNDSISRQAAIDALYDWERSYTWDEHCREDYDEKYIVSPSGVIEDLPSAQPERIIYANMSDKEFEKWLYEHGICNPNIHESIPCTSVPLLIDVAINELPSTQPERKTEWIPCSERLPEIRVDVLVTSCTGHVFVAERTNMDWNDWAGEWTFEMDDIIAWLPLPEPYKENKNDEG